jgi:hypothetical protein
MNNKSIIIISIIIAVLCTGLMYWFIGAPAQKDSRQKTVPVTISEKTAIALIQSRYTDLQSYPSDQLPPKSITTEKATNGWYVAFVQEGSGRPIISAKCFFVSTDKKITANGEYAPQVGDDSTAEFSPKTCLPSKTDNPINADCVVENCHGLDISCGSNPPAFCTAMYALGDKCLQYAQCGIQNGTCRPIENDNFTQCKSCVQNCNGRYQNDSVNLFECESRCT